MRSKSFGMNIPNSSSKYQLRQENQSSFFVVGYGTGQGSYGIVKFNRNRLIWALNHLFLF
jgi:hypothetical protein